MSESGGGEVGEGRWLKRAIAFYDAHVSYNVLDDVQKNHRSRKWNTGAWIRFDKNSLTENKIKRNTKKQTAIGNEKEQRTEKNLWAKANNSMIFPYAIFPKCR